jgi:hypothetical protein
VGGVYTGQVAVRRGETADPAAVAAAVDRAATQRVNAYGLPPSAVSTVREYYTTTGQFPDLRGLVQGGGAAAGPIDPGVVAHFDSGGGLNQNTIMLLGIGLVLVLVLTRKR